MLTALGRAALRRATVACAARTLSVSSLRATPVVMQLSSKTALPPTTWSGVLAVRTFATTRRNTKGAKKGTATKKKAAPKKKKAKAKKAAAPKKKRVISPLAKARAERRELLSKALFDEPAQLPATPWLVYVSEHTKGTKLASGQFGSHMKQLAANFKNLSTFEIQRLQTIASENKVRNNAAYKAWVEAHPAEVIAEANKARTRLARVYFIPRRTKKTSADGTSSRSSVNLIRDERLPKSPSSAYILFAKSRWATGDLQGMGIRDASRQVAKEWKELPESDRQPFIDQEKADMDRYEREVQSVLGRTVTRKKSP